MPKIKTVKGVKDRFRVTRTGKVLAFQPGRRHLLSGKRMKIKRHLRKPVIASERDAWKIRTLLPYQ